MSKESQAAWRATNREALLEKKRVYHHANRQAILPKLKARYEANRAPYLARARRFHEENREAEAQRLKERYTANRDRELAARRAHYAANKVAYVARAKARKLLLRNRLPAWADTVAITEVYDTAEWLRQQGIDVHVDHFYPLQGETVSGLHVHNNLQILSAVENRAKSNKVPEA